jgi:hypothetical protein
VSVEPLRRGTVAAVGPLALASRRVGGQGRADDQAVTVYGVDAEEVAMARPASPALSEGYPERGGWPTLLVVGDPAGYADSRSGGGIRHVAYAETTPCGG